jgi:mannose-6-phosphate isomerase-like protein (cupin superfamily)
MNEVVERPWGTYTVVGRWSDRITVKILKVNAGSRLSLQKHRSRDEEWLCLSGSAQVRVGDRTFRMRVGDRATVPRNRLHRISSPKGVELLEVSFGKHSEEDISRVEDDYGRADDKASRRSKR